MDKGKRLELADCKRRLNTLERAVLQLLVNADQTADKVVELAKRVVKYKINHSVTCQGQLKIPKECDCGRDKLVAELEEIVRENENTELHDGKRGK